MSRSITTRRGPLPKPEVRADETTLTQFAGLVPLLLFMNEHLSLTKRLRDITGPSGSRRTHPVHLVLLAFVVGALAGAQRLAHLEWMRGDVVLHKYLRLSHLPVRKVFTAALSSLSDQGVAALELLVAEVGRTLRPRPSSITFDLDNTAIIDHGHRPGSLFGYCGKGRRRRRHYPFVASSAEDRTVFFTRYRDGSSQTGVEVVGFLEAMVHRARDWYGEACTLFIRADAGFATRAVLNWLDEHGLGYVFAHPLSPGIKLMLMTTLFDKLDEEGDIEAAILAGPRVGQPDSRHIVIIRRRVHDGSAPPQGKRIDWSPQWRYQAMVTNQDWEPEDVWRFYNQRGDCENVFRAGKQGLGLGNLVGRSFRANEVAFLLRLLAYNIDRAFHHHAEKAARAENRPAKRLGLLWRQSRFYLSPGRLLREMSRPVLRVPRHDKLAELWEFYGPPCSLHVSLGVAMA